MTVMTICEFCKDAEVMADVKSDLEQFADGAL